MDSVQIADRLTQWLESKVQGAGARGVVFGLSGGVDSAVVGALACRACGDNVLGIIMPCEQRTGYAGWAVGSTGSFYTVYHGGIGRCLSTPGQTVWPS